MPMDAHDIESMIKAAIPDAEVTIRDLAGDGDHYAATVISESFRGKSRVQQHQIVYQSLKGQMGGVLHALALQTGVPGGPGCRKADRIGGAPMAADNARGALFRPIVPNQHSRVTYAELFFDLVFVFAVTQISHTLLGHFTPLGRLQVTLLFLAVWWVWVYTSWITNWLNPEKTPVRMLLFALMLGGLVLSTSIPKAFDDRGLWFALAYAAMQVGKTVFLWLSTPPSQSLGAHECDPDYVLAVAVGGVLDRRRICERASRGWCCGRLRSASNISRRRCGSGYPRYGASSVADWVVEGGHMAERCAGFIIIALGESIVVTGATFAELTWTTENVAAFVSAFVGTLAMWWIYFHKGAEAGSEQISRSSEPGRLARLAYTYLHMPIVAGIIVTAVADELVLKHPQRPFRSQDGAERDRRAAAVPDRNDPVQAQHSRLPSALARRRHHCAGRARLVRARTVAAVAVDPHHRDHGRGRGVGIDLAEVRRGGIAKPQEPVA